MGFPPSGYCLLRCFVDFVRWHRIDSLTLKHTGRHIDSQDIRGSAVAVASFQPQQRPFHDPEKRCIASAADVRFAHRDPAPATSKNLPGSNFRCWTCSEWRGELVKIHLEWNMVNNSTDVTFVESCWIYSPRNWSDPGTTTRRPTLVIPGGVPGEPPTITVAHVRRYPTNRPNVSRFPQFCGFMVVGGIPMSRLISLCQLMVTATPMILLVALARRVSGWSVCCGNRHLAQGGASLVPRLG